MKNNNKKAFTLIELIVSMSIFSMMMISVISIFSLVSDINAKMDVNRVMQENTKQAIEVIAEEIRKSSWTWSIWIITKDWSCEDWSSNKWTSQYICVWKKKIWLYSKNSNDTLISCNNEDKKCSLGINDYWLDNNEPVAITNSWVHIKNLEFSVANVSDSTQPRVKINFQISPATGKWIKTAFIKNNVIDIQTTLSKRLYQSE